MLMGSIKTMFIIYLQLSDGRRTRPVFGNTQHPKRVTFVQIMIHIYRIFAHLLALMQHASIFMCVYLFAGN